MQNKRYAVGTEIQYRNGVVKVKTPENGIVAKSRVVASLSSKVINGGEELEEGWRVMHLDMSTFGEPGHDRPDNLVVIKCRKTKFSFLKSSRIVFNPPAKLASEKLSKLVLR